MRVSSNVLIAQAVLALRVAAAAVTQTSEVVAGSRTTLAVRTRLVVPTAAPTQARLQERQFLCHLLGTCRTTAEEDAPANPKAAATSSSATSASTTSSTSTTTSTSTTSSTVSSTSSSSSVTSTTSSSTSSSVSSSTTSSSVSSTSSTESSTSTTPSSTSSSSSATSLSQSVVTVTSIVTGSDGKQSTSVSASSTAVGVPVQNNSSGGGLSGKTWGIIGGVVGGVAALLVGLFVIWRLAKRRSSNRAMDEIAWPELQNDATGGGFSVLNPPGTRQTGGAGFEMEKDREGGEGGDYYDDDDEEGEIRNGGWAAAGGAVSPRLGYDPRSSAQYYGSEGGQYGYMPDYGGQPASRNYYDPYHHHQEAPLPPLPPPSAALSSGRNSPALVVTGPTTGPSTSPQPGQNLPYPGSPIRSSEMVDSAYPPRSSRIYSSGAGAEDAYGGYAGMSTDDVPLTASAQYPAGAGAGIPYHPGAASPSPLYSPGR